MADEPDWDDPERVRAWEAEQRRLLVSYVTRQRLRGVEPAERPEWSVPPYIAVWALVTADGGRPIYWVISGDLPSDFVPAETAAAPRDAIRQFASRWRSVASYMERGLRHPTVHIGPPERAAELAPLLSKRAATLAMLAEDDECW